jgi:hypothetical protein
VHITYKVDPIGGNHDEGHTFHQGQSFLHFL